MTKGKELKIKRVILDIKATEIARYLGVSKSYISKMENNVQGIPEHIYKKWSKYLGIK